MKKMMGIIIGGVFCFVLIGCNDSTTEPITAEDVETKMPPEAPSLSARVERGELPPVEERLPEKPFVVETFDHIGQYGGTWNRLATGRNDLFAGLQRLAQEMWFMLDYKMNRMNVVIEDYESDISSSESFFRVHLRKGLKWSDGQPSVCLMK